MTVLLAYAAFILFLAAPFILLVLVGAGCVSALGLLVAGIRAHDPATIAGAVTLFAVSVGSGWFGWDWLASWHVEQPRISAVHPITPEMTARPRTITMRVLIPRSALAGYLHDGTFDRFAGQRRWMPMPVPKGEQLTLQYWDALHEGRLKPGADCAQAEKRPLDCFDIQPIAGPKIAPSFGFTDDTDRVRSVTSDVLYFYDGETRTELFRCDIAYRRPRHPLFSMRYEFGGGLALETQRMRDCRVEMIRRLGDELRRLQQ